MKTINNIKKLIKSNKKIFILLSIQIFLVLFFTVTSINEYRESVKIYNKGLNSKLENAIFYMGKVPYKVFKNGEEIINTEELSNARNQFDEFYEENIESFEGILDSKNVISIIDENGSGSGIYLYDQISMEEFLDSGFNPELKNRASKNNIPVLVNNNFKSNYSINQKINVKSLDESDLTLEVIGYYNENNSYYLSKDYLGNTAPNLSDLLFSMDRIDGNKFIALQDDVYIDNFTNNYMYGEPIDKILYVKEEDYDKVVDDLDIYSKNNDIGYYSLVKDSIENEKESIYINRQKFLDFSIALYSVLLLTIISIGHISSKILRKRYEIYHLNGASRLNLYITTFFYYLAQFYFPIFIYSLFIMIGKGAMFDSYLFLMIRNGMFDIDLFVFIIMTIFIIIISSFISYLPIKNLKERRKVK